MKPFKQNVIDRLEIFADYEKTKMERNKLQRNKIDTWESLAPRELFDAIQHEHKENIRALKYAIKLVKENNK